MKNFQNYENYENYYYYSCSDLQGPLTTTVKSQLSLPPLLTLKSYQPAQFPYHTIALPWSNIKCMINLTATAGRKGNQL